MALAKYAISENNSQGRQFSEPLPTDRNDFQRDRDRIIHSSAFRRLEYKTQVFVNHESDLYRTRLTHSIEVAQIARSVAKSLSLNEELTEAIALAHDLGHTPFGHAGQDQLNQCMADFGGFEHNLHSLRIVDSLEERYAAFSGLNLCFETREGILKHCSLENTKNLGEIGKRFINKTQASLEAQLVNIADALAYNNHDVDDGLRSGLLSLDTMCEFTPFYEAFEHLKNQYPKANQRILIHETIRKMIHDQVSDLLTQTTGNLKDINSYNEVKNHSSPLVSFSKEVLIQHQALKKHLRHKLYKHPEIEKMTLKAHAIVHDIFNYYMNNPAKLPNLPESRLSEKQLARYCSDYIAGMTDRFAEKIWLTLR